MSVPVLTIDAFAEQPFQGNPAAVCFLPEPREAPWMQAIAREMNLSETAFVTPRALGPSGAAEPGCFDLRWFTPTVEVDLCGHATLASAHALWSTARLDMDTDTAAPARFHTRSGWLLARPQGHPYDGRITLDFPATGPAPAPPPEGLARTLGASLAWVGKSSSDYLVAVADEATVRGLAPDLAALAALPVRGVIVTARSDDPRFDFVSRFFAPAVGVPEDPVTGSAHCSLAPFWAQRLGRDALTGYQASSRGGVVGVQVRGQRVLITGRAITVMSGQLLV